MRRFACASAFDGSLRIMRRNDVPKTPDGDREILEAIHANVRAFLAEAPALTQKSDYPGAVSFDLDELKPQMDRHALIVLSEGEGYLENSSVDPKELHFSISEGHFLVEFSFEHKGKMGQQVWQYDFLRGACTRDGFKTTDIHLLRFLRDVSHFLKDPEIIDELKDLLFGPESRQVLASAMSGYFSPKRQPQNLFFESSQYNQCFDGEATFVDGKYRYDQVEAGLIGLDLTSSDLNYGIVFNFAGEDGESYFLKLEFNLLENTYVQTSSDTKKYSKVKRVFDLSGALDWLSSYLSVLQPALRLKVLNHLFLSESSREEMMQGISVIGNERLEPIFGLEKLPQPSESMVGRVYEGGIKVVSVLRAAAAALFLMASNHQPSQGSMDDPGAASEWRAELI